MHSYPASRLCPVCWYRQCSCTPTYILLEQKRDNARVSKTCFSSNQQKHSSVTDSQQYCYMFRTLPDQHQAAHHGTANTPEAPTRYSCPLRNSSLRENIPAVHLHVQLGRALSSNCFTQRPMFCLMVESKGRNM
jgi:hypothetical protein